MTEVQRENEILLDIIRIENPFPQCDLHLQSVEQSAASALSTPPKNDATGKDNVKTYSRVKSGKLGKRNPDDAKLGEMVVAQQASHSVDGNAGNDPASLPA